MGFDPEGGVGGVLAGVALVVVFAFALSWVFTTLGARAALAERGDEHRLHGLFPLIFLSNIFVEPDDAAERARGVRRASTRSRTS